MIIYTITNLINGKKYVGQTIHSMNQRMTGHKAAAKTNSYPLYHAFKKHGLASFVIEEIDRATSVDELNEKEVYWINVFDTLSPNGYNLKLGGNGGGCHSEESKKKIGLANSGKRNKSNTPRTEEHKLALSKALKGRATWNKGKQHSQETIEKMRIKATGRPAWNKGTGLTRAKKKLVHICYDCSDTVVPNRTRCAKHLQANRLRNL